jgi:HAD superfamily hydrolase (TIGR01484 family)
MMRMKILGSDLDGTLSHGGIGEAKCAAIHAWREAGHKFGIISGRGGNYYPELRRNYPLLEFDFFAACNGGYIVDGDGRVIYEARCEDVSVPDFVADLSAWGCKFAHIIGEVYFCAIARQEDAPTWINPENIVLLDALSSVSYFNQISVQLPTVAESAAMVERIRESYGEWLTPLQNGTCIDIVPRGINKAVGLHKVRNHFGAQYEDTIAVGDNINDADMIREFHSYAMANGVDLIKELADDVVEDVTDLILKEM